MKLSISRDTGVFLDGAEIKAVEEANIRATHEGCTATLSLGLFQDLEIDLEKCEAKLHSCHSTWMDMVILPRDGTPVLVRINEDPALPVRLAMFWRPKPEWKETHPQYYGDGSGHWRWFEADERIQGDLAKMKWTFLPV